VLGDLCLSFWLFEEDELKTLSSKCGEQFQLELPF
jgi:hypothetical protein